MRRVRAPAFISIATDQFADNPVQNIVGIAKDIVIPEPEHAPSLALQPGCSAFIRMALRVLPAIDLDNQSVGDTGEIRDERTDRMLAAEFMLFQSAIAECFPEPAFRFG